MVKVPTTQSNVNFAFATRTNILRPTSRSGPCHLLLLQCRVHFSQLRWGQKSRPMCGKVLSCTKKYFTSLSICYTTIFSGPFLKIKVVRTRSFLMDPSINQNSQSGQGGQGFQFCQAWSAPRHPFDTLVTGMALMRDKGGLRGESHFDILVQKVNFTVTK